MSNAQDAEKSKLSLLDMMHGQALTTSQNLLGMAAVWHGTRRAVVHEMLGPDKEAYIRDFDEPFLKPAEEMVYLGGQLSIMMGDLSFKYAKEMSKLYCPWLSQ